jgi:hypothetical protein
MEENPSHPAQIGVQAEIRARMASDKKSKCLQYRFDDEVKDDALGAFTPKC